MKRVRRSRTLEGIAWSGLGVFLLGAAALPGLARADEDAPKIHDEVASKAKPVAPTQAKTVAVDPKAPFDVSELGAVDRETEKAIAKLDEACVASPMSREGPSPREQARCDLAMAHVVARGKAGASAILVALNEPIGTHPYYARSQLYSALGKIDDPKARSVLIAGLEKIGKEQLEDYQSDTYDLERTLFAMFGTEPDPAAPWETQAAVSDAWEESKQLAASWRKVETTWAGKKRNEVVITRLTSAKKDKTSDDPLVAYRAIAYLVKQTPRNAKLAATSYAKRKDLDASVAAAFEDLSSEADFRLMEPQARM